MGVLLISSNRLRPSTGTPWVPVEPLGAAYVAASLRHSGHAVELLDLCFEEDCGQAVREAIARERPSVIGISLRNIDLMTYFNRISFIPELKETVDECRRSSPSPIVLGGSGFSVMPRELMTLTGADFGVVGEGEWSFPELVRRIERGESPEGVPGVVIPGPAAGSARVETRSFRPLAGQARPARDLIDWTRYRAAGAVASIQTKRGCPFGCIYCTYPQVEGAVVRPRPAEEVAAEFRELADAHGARDAYVVDSQFNHPMSHAGDVCERLAAQRDSAKIRWWCMVNPAHLSEELTLLMRVARCTGVDLSVESGSDRVLESLGKGYSVADVSRAVGILTRCRLPFATWILCGGPGEDQGTLRDTLRFLDGAGVKDVLFTVGIRICPGTPIERMARKEGVIGDHTNLLEPTYYLSLPAAEIVAAIEPYLHGRPGWRIAALPSRS